MSQELKYSSSLTGAPFLLFEFKRVASLATKGFNEQEIKEKVNEDNLFDYKYPSTIKRVLPSLLRRVKVLDETLLSMVLEESIETVKHIILYTIMKTDRLFFEFMDEVIREKLQSSDYLLERKDLNIFFASKAEQNAIVAGWTEKNVNKLKQVYTKVLFEASILTDRRNGTIKRPLIDESLHRHLNYIGDAVYLKAMGDDKEI